MSMVDPNEPERLHTLIQMRQTPDVSGVCDHLTLNK